MNIDYEYYLYIISKFTGKKPRFKYNKCYMNLCSCRSTTTVSVSGTRSLKSHQVPSVS